MSESPMVHEEEQEQVTGAHNAEEDVLIITAENVPLTAAIVFENLPAEETRLETLRSSLQQWVRRVQYHLQRLCKCTPSVQRVQFNMLKKDNEDRIRHVNAVADLADEDAYSDTDEDARPLEFDTDNELDEAGSDDSDDEKLSPRTHYAARSTVALPPTKSIELARISRRDLDAIIGYTAEHCTLTMDVESTKLYTRLSECVACTEPETWIDGKAWRRALTVASYLEKIEESVYARLAIKLSAHYEVIFNKIAWRDFHRLHVSISRLAHMMGNRPYPVNMAIMIKPHAV